jgi:phage tail-like protein
VTEPAPSLINYLPAIYRSDPLTNQLLSAFEAILIGSPNDDKFPSRPIGIENTIAQIDRLFDPDQTPEDFLPWLSSWTAFSLRADLSIPAQREFIAKVVSLYRRRGTKKNLQDLLTIFTQNIPEITETETPFCFRVKIRLSGAPADATRQLEIIRALIDLEKPAHTYYFLNAEYPSLQIRPLTDNPAQIGVNTILGTIT